MDLVARGTLRSLTCFPAPSHRGYGVTRPVDVAPGVVSLPMNGTFDVEQASGRRIRCVRGSLWITHWGDGRDLVLGPGSSFVGDRETPMFIQALTPAEFTIGGP